MKKISVGALIVVLALLVWAGFYYSKNSPGAETATDQPKAEIVGESPKAGATLTPTSTTPPAVNQTDLPLKLPAGFSISVFAKNLGNARAVIFDGSGTLLVSITDQGKIVALPDKNGDGKADRAVIVASGLNKPHGMVIHGSQLFVAETDKIRVFDYGADNKAVNPKKLADLPTGGGHFTRSLAKVTSNGKDFLLVASGSSCNVCNENDPLRAAIYSLNLDGSDFKAYATGLRNSVFMAVSPQSGKILATEMGRDNLGDNLPPDEINIIEDGKNYGWPICYGKNIHDSNFDKNQYIQDPCNNKAPSFIDLPAHSAPLGLAFIPDSWPKEYSGDLIVAFHGSWNRSQPTGYKLAKINLDASGNYENTEDFISGWLASDGKTALGRPVGVIFSNDGTMYVSDDKAGVIYKVVYNK